VTRVLIAPDKFKGSLTALQVGQALADGIRDRQPSADCRVLPVADGGDGTLAAAEAAGFRAVPVTVTGPTGAPVVTSFARRDEHAVIEMADCCGLSRLPDGVLAPLTASSRGLGDAIRAALDAGCTDLVIGVGGSASTDGGAGVLAALGAGLLDNRGQELPSGGAALAELDRIELDGLHPGLAAARIRIACDVDNPLTGPLGAAAVYGPQKGASVLDVRLLDDALTRFADILADTVGQDLRTLPGAGAAGGVAFGAAAVLGAELTPGVELVFGLIGFDEALAEADVVITGEGSLDEQTLHGKAPAGVAAAASRSGVPVIGVGGRCLLAEDQWRTAGFREILALSDREPDVNRSMTNAADLLRAIGRDIGEQL
jgi:glycerate 2-kinase